MTNLSTGDRLKSQLSSLNTKLENQLRLSASLKRKQLLLEENLKKVRKNLKRTQREIAKIDLEILSKLPQIELTSEEIAEWNTEFDTQVRLSKAFAEQFGIPWKGN